VCAPWDSNPEPID